MVNKDIVTALDCVITVVPLLLKQTVVVNDCDSADNGEAIDVDDAN